MVHKRAFGKLVGNRDRVMNSLCGRRSMADDRNPPHAEQRCATDIVRVDSLIERQQARHQDLGRSSTLVVLIEGPQHGANQLLRHPFDGLQRHVAR